MSTREDLIRAALRLFAEHGFERTTIAAIEGEAGLAAGSGGLYRHFPSKRALLDSAIDWAQEDRSSFAMADDRLYSVDAPAEALRAVAELALEAARAGTDLSLVLMRVEESRESLDEDHRHALIIAQYKRLAGWLELFARAGTFREVDYEATAAVMLSSLVWCAFAERLTGTTAGGVDDERFLSTWVAAQLANLTENPKDAPDAQPS